jgi:hypothetical protein
MLTRLLTVVGYPRNQTRLPPYNPNSTHPTQNRGSWHFPCRVHARTAFGTPCVTRVGGSWRVGQAGAGTLNCTFRTITAAI